MKILYLDLGMGAAGDMLTAALLDSMNEKDKAETIKEISSLGIPDVTFDVEKSVKCGITGTHVSVKVHGVDEAEGLHEGHDHEHDVNECENVDEHHHDHKHNHNHEHYDHEHHNHEHPDHEHHDHEHHDHEHHDHEHLDHEHHDHEHHNHEYHDHGHHDHEHHHHHASLQKINNIVDNLNVSDEIKSDVKSIYKIIAEAEGHVHNKPVTEIHFHEVGTMDAVADITAACVLIRKIGADKILASPIHVGSGNVKCAHGILPVPAPATAYILKGIPMYSTDLKGELCTPTGAAILKYFVDEFRSMPAMTSDDIGYGMGFKDFERANCVRAIVGTSIESQNDIALNKKSTKDQEQETDNSSDTDSIIELRCNIDDMTGEEIGFAFEQLLAAGARDVFTTPITMKKNRPGILLTVICSTCDRDKMVREIFKHTTTIGIRETICNRYILDRTEETLNTTFGQVRKKRVKGYGVERSKLEYEDISKIARNTGMSLKDVKDSIGK